MKPFRCCNQNCSCDNNNVFHSRSGKPICPTCRDSSDITRLEEIHALIPKENGKYKAASLGRLGIACGLEREPTYLTTSIKGTTCFDCLNVIEKLKKEKERKEEA